MSFGFGLSTVHAPSAAPAPVYTYDTLDAVTIGAGLAVTGDGLILTKTGNSWVSAKGTMAKSTGKWQYEVEITTDAGGGNLILGAGNSSASVDSWCGADTNGAGLLVDLYRFAYAGAINIWSLDPAGLGAAVAGDIITVFFDLDAGTIGAKKNGVYVTDTPGTRTFSPSVPVKPMISPYQGGYVLTVNFGAGTLAYPEAGYNAGWYE